MKSEKNSPPASTKPLSVWLFACAGMVALMMIVGAITRLTESGLSMVEWRPLIGALPPLNEAEWLRVFDLYQQSPQYQKVHFWMEMSDFKRIFFWEWFHRLLGRTVGMVYALPLIWFWVRGMIPQGYKLKLLGMLILGGLQGLMGWYMVQSGLVDIPAVSHYRLAAHLSLAMVLFVFLLWLGLSISGARKTTDPILYRHAKITFGFVCVTILWGAFTAGLDAGLVYNDSFPMMGGKLIPPDLWFQNPAWINLFANPVGVQFTHRWIAIITALVVLSLFAHAMKRDAASHIFHALAFVVLIQVGLGISTLLSGVVLPLAVMHQAGAITLLGLLSICLYRLRPGQQPD